MQRIVNIINDWCTENELLLSPHKTSLVLFTWKRKFSIDTPIMVVDQPLSYSKDVKYLGVILDQKLNWGKHINYATNKATKSLYTTKRVEGKRWGYSANTARRVYRSVVIPTFTYGCHLWGLSCKASAKQSLKKIQDYTSMSDIYVKSYNGSHDWHPTSPTLLRTEPALPCFDYKANKDLTTS
jgi:hypothetical protein